MTQNVFVRRLHARYYSQVVKSHHSFGVYYQIMYLESEVSGVSYFSVGTVSEKYPYQELNH